MNVIQKGFARRDPAKQREYFVQWFGHPFTYVSWEPAGNLAETMRDRYDLRLTNAPPVHPKRVRHTH